jgi:hypothetical protein
MRAVQIHFNVADQPARLQWSVWTGRAKLYVGSDRFDRPMVPADATRRSFGRVVVHLPPLVRVWNHAVGGHTVAVEDHRPNFLGGLRKHMFVVSVDGQEAARQTGW